MILIDNDHSTEISREQYDILRSVKPSVVPSVCHAPFVSLSLHRSGRIAPCPYFSSDYFRKTDQSLESIWQGEFFNRIRTRFRNYHVKRGECASCIDCWELGMAKYSPAICEFDPIAVTSEQPIAPVILNLDLRDPLSDTDLNTIFSWLKHIQYLNLSVLAQRPDPIIDQILENIRKFPSEQRPCVNVRTHDILSEPVTLPNEVKTFSWDLSSAGDTNSDKHSHFLEKTLATSIKYSDSLILDAWINRQNWIHLRSWLQLAEKADVIIRFYAAPGAEKDALANLDGDALSCIHRIMSQWLGKFHPNQDRCQTFYSPDLFLAVIRKWIIRAGERQAPSGEFAFPDGHHSICQDEKSFELFLSGTLRIYDDPRVESWLSQIVFDDALMADAADRTSLRLSALWLACVFERTDVFPVLRSIYEDRKSAACLVNKDRSCLSGTPWESWYAGWIKQLNLDTLQLRHSVFKTGALKKGISEKLPAVTIIIPSYNHETFIADAVKSVLAQTRTDYHLLVIDDASRDNTLQVVQDIRDPRIQVMQNSRNLGLGHSLARALKQVDTEFTAILNSDDLYHPDRLETCLSVLGKNRQWSLVATGLVPIDRDNRACTVADSTPVFDGLDMYYWLRWYENTRPDTVPSNLFDALLERNFLISTSNIVARTDFIKSHMQSWQDLEFCIDWYLFLTGALECTLCCLSETLLGYRLHQSNTVWFDTDRRHRYYLEANRIVARILETLYQRKRDARTKGLSEVLGAVAGPLKANTVLDWPGVLLGMFIEREKLHPEEMNENAWVQKLQLLEQKHDFRDKADTLLEKCGQDISGFYRMRSEYPYLRSIRNSYEAINGEYHRLRGELSVAEMEKNIAVQKYQELKKRQTEIDAAHAAEYNAVLQSPEYRLGRLMLDKLRLRKPITAVSSGLGNLEFTVNRVRMSTEGRLLRGGKSRYKILAAICCDFPIYSQTFVHQELVQMTKGGFDLRLIYSFQNPRDHLHTQFKTLWDIKRRLPIHRPMHQRHFSMYLKKMPTRVESLIGMLTNASGLKRRDLIQHDNFLQAFSFTRLIESYQPHYLHSYFFYDRSLMMLVAGYLLNIPRGVSCYADHLLQDYELKVVPLHLKLCDVIVATSERIKEELLTIAPDIDADRIIVKANAVDTSILPIIKRFEPESGKPFRLVCVSRIEPKKGLLYLVEAVDILRRQGLPVELHLIGEADERFQDCRDYNKALNRLISDLDLWECVHMEGRCNQEGVIRFLKMSHLFVAPFVVTETGDKDGIPTALLEAMSTGLPVVVTDAGSVTEVVENGREGIIVPQRDASRLAGAIKTLLNDSDQRARMGVSAAEKIRSRFDVSVCERRLHERIRSVIGGSIP